MSKHVVIQKDSNVLISSKVVDFLSPDLTYYPYDKNIKLKIKLNDYVYKFQNIFDNGDIPIFSTISGTFIGVSQVINESAKKMPCVVIENDFKEKTAHKTGVKKYINNYSKEEFINILKKCGITENNTLIGNMFIDDFNNLIVNALDVEAYVATELFTINNYYFEIFECIDAIHDIFAFNKCFILINNKENEIITNLINSVGTYPYITIKPVEEVYNYLFNKAINDEYNFKNPLFLKSTTLFSIYKALKRSNKNDYKYITISGNAVENPIVLNVKIGSRINSVLKDMIKFNTNDYICVANGLVHGYKVDCNFLVITNELNSLIINKKEKHIETDCISCGKCYKVCPYNVDPKYVMDHNNKFTKLKKMYQSKCKGCNLCSYVCPARINLRKYLKGGKGE